MSPSSVETTPVVSVVCALSLRPWPKDFKSLEEQIVETVQASARELYAQAVRAFQEHWLAEHRKEFSAVRWRAINQITPFGYLRLPVRVVRQPRDGRYHSLSKVLLAPRATPLLSPAIEKQALEAAAGRNYRPAGSGAGALAAHRSERLVDLALRAIPARQTLCPTRIRLGRSRPRWW